MHNLFALGYLGSWWLPSLAENLHKGKRREARNIPSSRSVRSGAPVDHHELG
jgi:hypothetical protein